MEKRGGGEFGVGGGGSSIVSSEAQKCNGDGDENDTRGPLNTALEEEGRRGEGKGRLDGCGRRRRGGICINMSQLLCDELLAGLLLSPEKLTALHVRPMVIPYRYNSVGTSS